MFDDDIRDSKGNMIDNPMILDRNNAVNLLSILKHGTIEFRAHPGTTNPRDIISWVKFVNNVAGLSQDMIVGSQAAYPQGEERQKLRGYLAELRAENSHVIGNSIRRTIAEEPNQSTEPTEKSSLLTERRKENSPKSL